MSYFKKVDLEFENGGYIHFNEDYLKPYCLKLLELISDQDYVKNINFAKK